MPDFHCIPFYTIARSDSTLGCCVQLNLELFVPGICCRSYFCWHCSAPLLFPKQPWSWTKTASNKTPDLWVSFKLVEQHHILWLALSNTQFPSCSCFFKKQKRDKEKNIVPSSLPPLSSPLLPSSPPPPFIPSSPPHPPPFLPSSNLKALVFLVLIQMNHFVDSPQPDQKYAIWSPSHRHLLPCQPSAGRCW